MGSEVAIRSTALTHSSSRDGITLGSLVYPNQGAPEPTGSGGPEKASLKSALVWAQLDRVVIFKAMGW